MSHKESAAAARSDRSLGIRGRRLLSGGRESFSSFYSFSSLRSRGRCEEGGGGSLALHTHDCFHSEGDLFQSHTSLDRSGVGVGVGGVGGATGWPSRVWNVSQNSWKLRGSIVTNDRVTT